MTELAGGTVACGSPAFAELSAEILRTGAGLRFRAHGFSMAPLVRDGDVLLVRPTDPSSVRIGDVVLCRSEQGRIVVHRVVSRLVGPDGHRFTVQGDAVSRPDEPIPGAQVYGRVVAIERDEAQIVMDRRGMRMLGWLAVLRSRWNRGRGRPCRLAARLLRKLPAFSEYLA